MNEYHDDDGAHEIRPPVVTPGSTPVRMLARAISDALTLPAPKTDHDAQLRFITLNQRARIVASVCKRIGDDIEGDSLDLILAASSISDRIQDFPVNYSVHPLQS